MPLLLLLGLFAITIITIPHARAPLYARPSAGQAQNSSTIILDQSGTQVWNVNPDNDSVTAIDVVRLEAMGEIAVGRQPRTLAQAPDGTVWTVNQGDATITVIDGASRVTLATIALPHGSEPYGIVFSPRQASAYVTLQSTGQLAEVDVASRTLIRTLDVGPTPRALALSADGERLFVTRFISSTEFPTEADQAQGEVIEVDPLAWQLRRILPLAYDPGPDTGASSRGVPNGLAAAAISPAGDQLWIGARKANTARGAQRDGQQLTFDSTVRSILATVNLETNQEDLDNRYDFNDRDGPVALRFSPLGDYLFALLEGVNAVDIIDTYTHQLVTSIDDMGHAPQGLVFTADGGKLFIHSWLTRSVLAYDVNPLFGRNTIDPQRLAEIPTVTNDQTPPLVLQGKQVFYNAADPRMSRGSYLSCASCHFDSREDGQIWDRTAEGEGLRNTISLLGKGSPGHGDFHWSANFDEVQDFEHDMRANFGGQGFMPDTLFNEGTRNNPLGDPKASLSTELDALAAYVDSLRTLPQSPYRNPDGSLTPDGEAGRLIFISAGCTSCHGGPQFTDSPTGQLHQVGTVTTTSGSRLGGPLRGIDTPSLRGLWLTAPYLHDGSASSLEEIFTARGSLGLYGDLQSFVDTNPRAIEQLVAYLLQLDDSEPGFDLASPAIEIFTPAAGTRGRVGEALSLTVNVRAVMGPASHVEFYAEDLLLGEAAGPLYSLTWTPSTSGVYNITAHLVYESGATTTSAPRRLEVIP